MNTRQRLLAGHSRGRPAFPIAVIIAVLLGPETRGKALTCELAVLRLAEVP